MRLGEITDGSNTPKQQAAYLRKHASYLGFREGPDGTRERFYIYNDQGFIVTEYGNDHEKIIVGVRTCSAAEARILMSVANVHFGE